MRAHALLTIADRHISDTTAEVTDKVQGSSSLTFHYPVDSRKDSRHRDGNAWPIRGQTHAPTGLPPLAPDKWGAAGILDNDIQPMGARARAPTEVQSAYYCQNEHKGCIDRT